jgi:hypothetical protein
VVSVVDTSGDVEDHGLVEEVGAGEAKAVVAVGLGEMGIFSYIHRHQINHLSLLHLILESK